MKKFLPIYCFFFLQIVSCHFGEIEPRPEATKFSIKNNSSVQLLNVRWNGTNFGDIGSGEVSEREVSDREISNESNYVFFLASNGKQYNNYYPGVVKKHRHNQFPFIDVTLVVDNATSDIILLRDVLNAD